MRTVATTVIAVAVLMAPIQVAPTSGQAADQGGAAATAAGADPWLVRPARSATPRSTDPSVVRQQRLEVVPGAQARLSQSPLLAVELFPDVSLRIVRRRAVATERGLSWSGVLEGYPASDAVFVVSGTELLGHIYAPFGFFRLRREGTGYMVQQVDPSPESERFDDTLTANEPDMGGGRTPTDESAADDGREIDVMVMYTPAALEGFGGEERAHAVVDLLVAEANQALLNSGIGAAIRLAHAAPIEYTETGDSQVDLTRLRGASDGFMDDVHRLRDSHAADLVVLVTERMDDFCGRAYVNGMNARGANGFSIVKRGCTGSGRTFLHELGHSLGANHDWYVTTAPGAFGYSKGYVSLAGRFRDLMSYANLCVDTRTFCAQLLQYSTPSLTRDGHPTGIPAGTDVTCPTGDASAVECDADVASTIETMAPLVARFRSRSTSGGRISLGPGE